MSGNHTDALIAGLQALIGDDGVLTEPHEILPYRGDIGCTAADVPLIVVRPRSKTAVSALVRFCAGANISITPRGGGSGFCGGATPSAAGTNVVISFERM